MSGSGMIAARPEGLAVDFAGQVEGCVSGWDGPAIDRPDPLTDGVGFSESAVLQMLRDHRHDYALGIICIAAAKCTEVQSLADCGRIDRDGADLFVRRYSESICDIVAALTENRGT